MSNVFEFEVLNLQYAINTELMSKIETLRSFSLQ